METSDKILAVWFLIGIIGFPIILFIVPTIRFVVSQYFFYILLFLYILPICFFLARSKDFRRIIRNMSGEMKEEREKGIAKRRHLEQIEEEEEAKERGRIRAREED